MMTSKIKTGKEGEQLAAGFLERQGFVVVARNYRFKRAEIDLIIRRGNWLVFVEVKTRSSEAYGEPEQFVTARQAGRIFKAAEAYIYEVDWRGHVRFDVVSVKPGDPPEISHFEDAIS